MQDLRRAGDADDRRLRVLRSPFRASDPRTTRRLAGRRRLDRPARRVRRRRLRHRCAGRAATLGHRADADRAGPRHRARRWSGSASSTAATGSSPSRGRWSSACSSSALLVATAIAHPRSSTSVFDVGSWLFASPLVHLAGRHPRRRDRPGRPEVPDAPAVGLRLARVRRTDRRDHLRDGCRTRLRDRAQRRLRRRVRRRRSRDRGHPHRADIARPRAASAASSATSSAARSSSRGRSGGCRPGWPWRRPSTASSSSCAAPSGGARSRARSRRSRHGSGWSSRRSWRGRDHGRPVDPDPARAGAQHRGRRRGGGRVVTAAVAAGPERRAIGAKLRVVRRRHRAHRRRARRPGCSSGTTWSEPSSRSMRGGLNAEVPAGWIVLPAAGDRLLTAYDPLDPDTALRRGGRRRDGRRDADARGRRRPSHRGPLEPARRRSPCRRRARARSAPSRRTRSATRSSTRRRAAGRPRSRRSSTTSRTARLFPEDRVLAVIVEATPDRLEAALPDFERFAREIAGRTGTAAAPDPSSDAGGGGGPLLASIGDPTQGAPTAPAAIADLVNATVQILMVATIGGPGAGVRLGLGHDHLPDRAHPDERPRGDAVGGRSAACSKPTRRPQSIPRTWSSRSSSPRTDPPSRSTARPSSSADGYLDAAVIQIDRDLDGRPLVEAHRWPCRPSRSAHSDSLHAGDPLTVVGFPGIGGDTISLSSGRVSGFLERRPDRVAGLDQDRRGHQQRQLRRPRRQRGRGAHRDPDAGARATSVATRGSGRSPW